MKHKRLQEVQDDRRGSIVTSTPMRSDVRRESVGFAETPRNGEIVMLLVYNLIIRKLLCFISWLHRSVL